MVYKISTANYTADVSADSIQEAICLFEMHNVDSQQIISISVAVPLPSAGEELQELKDAVHDVLGKDAEVIRLSAWEGREETAEQKAKELFDKFCQTISSNCEHESYCINKECLWKGIAYCKVSQNEAKQCAIICVDEILATCPQKENEIFAISRGIEHWQQVRNEITKL